MKDVKRWTGDEARTKKKMKTYAVIVSAKAKVEEGEQMTKRRHEIKGIIVNARSTRFALRKIERKIGKKWAWKRIFLTETTIEKATRTLVIREIKEESIIKIEK